MRKWKRQQKCPLILLNIVHCSLTLWFSGCIVYVSAVQLSGYASFFYFYSSNCIEKGLQMIEVMIFFLSYHSHGLHLSLLSSKIVGVWLYVSVKKKKRLLVPSQLSPVAISFICIFSLLSSHFVQFQCLHFLPHFSLICQLLFIYFISFPFSIST